MNEGTYHMYKSNFFLLRSKCTSDSFSFHKSKHQQRITYSKNYINYSQQFCDKILNHNIVYEIAKVREKEKKHTPYIYYIYIYIYIYNIYTCIYIYLYRDYSGRKDQREIPALVFQERENFSPCAKIYIYNIYIYKMGKCKHFFIIYNIVIYELIQ